MILSVVLENLCLISDKQKGRITSVKGHRTEKSTARWVALMGMLVALNVVMAEVCKIVIIPNVLVLSLGFLPLALSGMLFGIVPTVTVAVIVPNIP